MVELILILNKYYNKINNINILRGEIITMRKSIISIMRDIGNFFGYIAEIRNRRIFIPYDIFHCISGFSKDNIKNLHKTKL